MIEEDKTKAVLKTLWICLAANLLVSGLKLFFAYYSHTLAFLADGIHSLFDAVASILGIFSVIQAAKPPDEGHPYGHRKSEVIAAVGLALLLVTAAFEVSSLAIDRLRSPLQSTHLTPLAFLALVLNFFINLGISKYEEYQARKYGSRILHADAMHTQSDSWVTLAVLFSFAANFYQVPYIDAVLSIGIAIYLGFLAVQLILSNVEPLVDTKVLDPREVEKIVTSVEGVLHCHQVRSRGEIDYHFLDLNIHLDGQLTLERAHTITHEVEKKLRETFPGLVDVVIHTEPDNHPPCC